MIKKTPLACAIGSIVLGMTLSALAQAENQDADASNQLESEINSTVVELDQETDAESVERSMGSASVEEVVVTGSRISKDVFSSASPIDVITIETADVQGIDDIGTLLQTATVASGSPQVTAASSTAFVQNGGSGVQTISLRGLGANRTLVLLNGRRAGPAGVRGAVSAFDFNTLPLSAIERVEVLKDGASSIYGSDAVAGVVNIITDKSEASSFNAFTSQPSESGGEVSRLDFSIANSTDKFRYRVTGDYYKRTELAKGDRDYFNCGEQYIFDESGNRADAEDPRTGSPHCTDLLWGHVWIYDYTDLPSRAKAQYDYDGDLGNYIPSFEDFPSMTTPTGWFPVAYDRASDGVTNADHPFQDEASLIPKIERLSFLGETSYDISDDHQVYAELLMNKRETGINSYRQFWSYTYNSNSDFFPANPAPTAQGWEGNQWLSSTPITDQNDSRIEVDYTRIVAGMKGNISDDWQYDTSIQYSKSDAEYHSQQVLDDAMKGNNLLGSTCEGTLLSSGVPCQDLPWFEPRFLNGEFTPGEKEYLFQWETGTTEYTQKTFEAHITGPVMELPAGELAIAMGIQYQTDEIIDTPGELTLNGRAALTSVAGITQGRDTTKAIFAEIDVPLLEDAPMVKSLNMSASGRYTDVDSYGSDTTYKAGLNWEITDTLRIRAGHGTSFRTPALYELYLADQTSSIRQTSVDPCIRWEAALDAGDISQRTADNCAADGVRPDHYAAISATVIAGGGYGVLKAETSKTETLGIVWQPEFADLNMSIDYFDISISDEVSRLSASSITFGCYNSEFFPNEPLCNLFERDPIDGKVDNIRNSYLNIAQQKNRGWDLSILFRTELPWGELTLDTQHTFQIEDTIQVRTESTPVDYNGEMGDPKWTGRFSATLDRGNWSYFWGMNIIGDAQNYDSYGGDTATYRGDSVKVILGADKVIYHNFSVAYDFLDWDTRMIFGVNNAFDKKPPRLTTLNLGEVNTEGNSAFYSQYNWIGRSVFLNMKMTF
ncbi:MAG: TonB-dependent receptor [Porticoccaceae bacterium]|nr:TonB-dependent receptor [Porticoccaceae bacterium]